MSAMNNACQSVQPPPVVVHRALTLWRKCSRARAVVSAIVLLVITSACQSVGWSWREDSSRPKIDANAYPEEDAVIVRQSHLLDVRLRETKWHQHMVVKVLTEKGRDTFSRYEFALGDGQTLADFAARVIRPNGEIQEVGLDDAIEEDFTFAESDSTVRRVKLRLPGVEAGSLIEVVWTREYPFPFASHTLRMASASAPMLRYDAEIRVHKKMRFQVRTYHSSTPLEVTSEGQMQVVRLREKDIAKSDDEIYSPDWTMRDPFWKFARIPSDGVPKWEEAVSYIGRILYSDEKDTVDGFTTGLSRSDAACQTRACLIDHALAYVRKATDSVGGGSFYSIRPLKKVVGGRDANRFEKAVLLYQALDDLGIPAFYGLATQLYSRPTDTSFPSADWFNHLVVVVANAQGQRIVLDPSCEHCGRGKLPDGTRGAQILLVKSKSQLRVDEFETEFLTASGVQTDGDVLVESMRVELTEEGDASVRLHREWKGDAAAAESARIRSLTAEAIEARGSRLARQHIRHSVVKKVAYGEPNERFARLDADVEFTAPAYAVVDGDEIIVPLSLLSDAFGRQVRKSKKDDRVGDFYLASRIVRSDTVALIPPDGYEILSFPQSRIVEGNAFKTRAIWNRKGPALVLTRELTGRRGRYKKSAFDAVVKPLTAYAEVARDVVILRRSKPAKTAEDLPTHRAKIAPPALPVGD